jgi:hypothetical protein
MESNPRGSAATFAAAEDAGPGGYNAVCAGEAVTKLYEAHALGLIRLAHIMLGDRSSAEDVVQEAFCGLYRRWSHLADPASAVHYVRSSVLNGCRSVLRRGNAHRSLASAGYQPPESSAESVALGPRDPYLEFQNVLWTSPSGATLIVSDPRGKANGAVPGVLSGNRFTALPRAPLTNGMVW